MDSTEHKVTALEAPEREANAPAASSSYDSPPDRETEAKLEPVNRPLPNRSADGAVPWWEAHLDNPIHCITVNFKPEASRHQWRHDGRRLKTRGAHNRIHSTGGEDARTILGREGPGYTYGT